VSGYDVCASVSLRSSLIRSFTADGTYLPGRKGTDQSWWWWWWLW
jgi:hypothetical protein